MAELPKDPIEAVLAYHERTKHHLHGFARSPGHLDWANQPNPFRRYENAPVIALERPEPTPEPQLAAVYARAVEPRPVAIASISQLLFDSLALSAWKELGPSRWSLRCNPSSGNLHPTEAYLIADIPDAEGPALYHYAPDVHGLERLKNLPSDLWRDLMAVLPPDASLISLTGIHWREAWKYGERAFRYCQHDAGHAIAALAYAAATLGWQITVLDGTPTSHIAALAGLRQVPGPESEHGEALLVLTPSAGDAEGLRATGLPAAVLGLPEIGPLVHPNRLSRSHVQWPVISEVAAGSSLCAFSATRPDELPRRAAVPPGERETSARQIFRQRRSAVALDGTTPMTRSAFFGLLEAVMPSRNRVPFDAFPWRPMIHPIFAVHRVEGLEAGAYALVRDDEARERLAASLDGELEWTLAADELPFYRLSPGDARQAAQLVSCGQEIAADGAFAVIMLAELEPLLRTHGPQAYRHIHFEAGALGHVLYLEAEAAGLRGTGIGCFFDDAAKQMLGARDDRFTPIYHFTVGGPLEDVRIASRPAYEHLD